MCLSFIVIMLATEERKKSYKRPSVLEISFLLNHDTEPENNSMQHKTLRQHQMESKRIEQELLILKKRYNMSIYTYFNRDHHTTPAMKLKRRRASSKQLDILNQVFERTFFPSTQLRAELGHQLGMSPRTVQIWFQNRRQAIKSRQQQRSNSVSSDTSAFSL